MAAKKLENLMKPHLKKLEKKAQTFKAYRDAEAGVQKLIAPIQEKLIAPIQEWWIGDDDAADAAAAQELAREIDVDKTAKIFRRHAGFDDDMDEEEFEIFCEHAGIKPELTKSLWKLLDDDGSGSVTLAEFKQALIYLRQAAQWVRYCPTCKYQNVCAFCQEANKCSECTEERFCNEHWTEHPGRPDERRETGRQHMVAGTPAWVKEELVVRPLEVAYDAISKTKLPIALKSKVRQTLRQHQEASAEALAELTLQAELEEESKGVEEHLSSIWNPRVNVSAGGSLSRNVTWGTQPGS
eukprot:CAMPEP_0119079282 /NCGR_PEP_ID=MMETSP1178-20130426/106027_1 /TAXON_ID=33656 /ORGANISM="unid sp, Strain CCMP2000" /LENGTH=296 /DNA_ID=CAMNT_0007061793 /DNA_START=35 /DNA_END=925 /DNA_ORIENTATION=+